MEYRRRHGPGSKLKFSLEWGCRILEENKRETFQKLEKVLLVCAWPLKEKLKQTVLLYIVSYSSGNVWSYKWMKSFSFLSK